ncbi:helix-turn-helix domain-containing protein [Rhizobium sp. CFBP 8762]|nr:helix-turn-helix domain-containing protein [Rhizobium sp. CFBP 8762]
MWNINVLRTSLVHLTAAQRQGERILTMHSNGMSQRLIAKALGVSAGSVWRVITSAKARSLRA